MRAAEATSEPAVADWSELDLDALLKLNVITASGGEAESSDLAPANVFTVLGSEIANQGWRSVAEVLSHVPGIYLVDDYVTNNVGVRGVSGGLRAGSRIVKVMINGTDVSFRPDMNALIGPEFIPVETIERIEVARGPLSAVYGANAFLATVNVITVDPDRLGGQVVANGTVRPQTGSTRVGAGGAGMVTAKLKSSVKLLLAASYLRSDRGGLTIDKTFPAQSLANSPNLGATSGDDLARPLSVFGRALANLGRFGDLSVQGGLQQSDSNGEFQLGSTMTGQTREVVRNLWTEAQHDGHWTDRISSSVALGYAHGAPTADDKLFLAGNIDPANGGYVSYYTRNFYYDAVDARASLMVKPRAGLRFSGGVDAGWEHHGALTYSQHFLESDGVHGPGDVVDLLPHDAITLTKVAPNLHTSFDPVPSVRLSADGRIDKISLFPAQPSWRLAAGWRMLPNLVVKVVAGRAFQTPSTVFLYAQPGFGTGNIIGSRNLAVPQPLRPQVVQSGELVLNYVRGDHLSISLAGYLQSIQDQISFSLNGANYVASNQGTARSVGTEVNVTARVWRFEPYLRASQQWFAASPTRRPLDSGPDVPPPMVPAFWTLAGLRATVPSPRLTFNAVWRFVGERGASQSNIFLNNGNSYALPGYNQFDIEATAIISPLGKMRETRLLLAGRNLGGQIHHEPGFGGIDVPSMGRIVQLTLSQGF